jgi:hypothetical protein
MTIPNSQYEDGAYMCAVCCARDPQFMDMMGCLVCSLQCSIELRRIFAKTKKSDKKTTL